MAVDTEFARISVFPDAGVSIPTQPDVTNTIYVTNRGPQAVTIGGTSFQLLPGESITFPTDLGGPVVSITDASASEGAVLDTFHTFSS